MRTSEIKRVTNETDIKIKLILDGESRGFFGKSGVGFFDHMLNSFAVHGNFKIEAEITGDIWIDAHHTVEDIGIVLGKLFSQVLGDKSKIARFGSAFVPMDESLAFAAIDISGRPYLVFNADFSADLINNYDTQLTQEFFRALVFNIGANLHIKLEYGGNCHHETEAIYKAAARALAAAVTEINGPVLSAKGMLE